MPTWVIEVEHSVLNTYRVTTDNETNARMMAMAGYLTSVEEHENSRITSCIQESDED